MRPLVIARDQLRVVDVATDRVPADVGRGLARLLDLNVIYVRERVGGVERQPVHELTLQLEREYQGPVLAAVRQRHDLPEARVETKVRKAAAVVGAVLTGHGVEVDRRAIDRAVALGRVRPLDPTEVHLLEERVVDRLRVEDLERRGDPSRQLLVDPAADLQVGREFEVRVHVPDALQRR